MKTPEKRRWNAQRTSSRLTEPVRQSRLASSSRRWIERQLADPYVKAAREEGYRSRAAFKLLEIDERFGLVQKGGRVVDLGSSPGSWLQVALNRGAAQVVGVDLTPINPPDGTRFILGDANDPDICNAALAKLDGPPDTVLSDMAAPVIGQRSVDRIRTENLAEVAASFATSHLAPGGAFCCKVFQGGAPSDMIALLKNAFTTVRHVKPHASRKESPETFIIATGFRRSRNNT